MCNHRRPLARSAALRPRLVPVLGLLLAVALAGTRPAEAQWSTQSPVPTFLEVHGVAAPAPGHVLFVTEDDSFDESGALFETSDGGATWMQRDIPASLGDPLHGIQFLDAAHGWTWGNRNYRTLDGGVSWQELPLLGSTYDMRFHSPQIGTAHGNFGTQLTRDGGLSWEASPHDILALSFADAQTGLGAAADGLYRTTDGAATFDLVLAGEARAVVFLTASVAVAVVDDTFHRSTDGGLNWVAGQSADGRIALVRLSDDTLLATARAGMAPNGDTRLFRSVDGGQTWVDLGDVLSPGIDSTRFDFVSPAPGLVVAANGAGDLYRSTDTGASWTRVYASPGPGQSFFASSTLTFADAQTGYFGFGDGLVVATGDGGASWTQLTSGAAANLADLARFADGGLVAVGDEGTVLVSAAGAAHWVLRPRPTERDLAAVQVVDDRLLVVDSIGRVYQSTDRGLTWTTGGANPPGLEARDLQFESTTHGWVIGAGSQGSALFRTTDGGASWAPLGDFLGLHTAVDFIGASGWAARFDGRIRRTVDGGATWTETQLPGFDPPTYDLDFWDASIGYAVGDNGLVARSDDGGLTWTALPTPDPDDRFTAISLLGPDELWVTAADGAVLYSATGGQNWAALDAGNAGFAVWAAIAASPAGDAWIAGSRGRIRRFAGPPPAPDNRPPVAAFDFEATGLAVAFTDLSTDPDGTVVSWAWQFGDGATSSQRHPTHVFSEAGSYWVRLTVTDDDGATDVLQQNVIVQPGPGGTFGDFTEVTPLDPLFVTPQDEDFWVAATAAADPDGDGDLDIAVLGFYVVYGESVEEMLVLLRNQGTVVGDEWQFEYVALPLGDLTTGASDLAWGDVDGDGDPDLVVGSDGATVLYRNDAGTLVPTETVLPAYWEDNNQADFDLQSISWADFDNDGDSDLLLPSVWDDEASAWRTMLLRNDGSDGSGGFVFTEVDAGLPPTAHAQSAWGDFDGDLDLDLLLVHLAPLNGDGFLRRYRNDGDGQFTGEEILPGLTIEHGEAQWGDYDGDGDLDVLVAGHVREPGGTFANVLRIARNDGATHTPIEVLACPACDGWIDLTAATWADYDSDGDVDILLAGTYNSGSQIEGRARIYDNVGGEFVETDNQLPAPRSNGERGGAFSWLDIDTDGDLDYLIAGMYFVPDGNGLVEAQMHLYRNDADGENAAPSPPEQLASQVHPDGSVDLWWSPALDDHTPAAELTYALQLSRGGAPLPAVRRLPAPGDLSAGGAWTLAVLANGTYSWSLQAVDSAYNPGPPAVATFHVGPPPEPVFGDGFESGDTTAWSATTP